MAGNHATAATKVVIGIMGLCVAGYLLGPPLYWHFKEVLAAKISSSCPPCDCDCSSRPIITFSHDVNNGSLSDCSKRDPDVSEDVEKNFSDLLSEELTLREAEALDSQQRADIALLDAKKLASQFQKEADKCNSGMETCEEAREQAEAALTAQKKLSALWEMRARQRGWKEGALNARVHSQGNTDVA